MHLDSYWGYSSVNLYYLDSWWAIPVIAEIRVSPNGFAFRSKNHVTVPELANALRAGGAAYGVVDSAQ
jgi:hypothetical protein